MPYSIVYMFPLIYVTDMPQCVAILTQSLWIPKSCLRGSSQERE